MSAPRIAIVGFGFSGLMLLANLIREARTPHEVYVVATDLSGRGIAYSTNNTEHVLNVPAARMGAWADAPEDFHRWLGTPEGKAAGALRKLKGGFGPDDFVPRAIYGDYLQDIWQQAQEIAAQKKFSIKLVPAKVVGITRTDGGFAVATDRGDAIAADKVVITTGNEARAALPQLKPGIVVQNPWAEGALTPVVQGDGPVVLIGTGLTAVDMILSLRSAGYDGPIIASSRRGLLPQGHKRDLGGFIFNEKELFSHSSLAQLMLYVRATIKTHKGDWREVIDALRPHTQSLWQRLSLREQQLFIARLLPYWNVHRHRMAPQIAAKLDQEIHNGDVRIFSCRNVEAVMDGGKAKLEVTTTRGVHKIFYPSHVINCIGPELRVHANGQNLFKQMIADRLAEAAAVGMGLAADPKGRVFGEGYPDLYAIGSLRTGQLLESTAVPELRVQAAAMAKDLA